MDYSEQIEEAERKMHSAEDALIDAGFSEEHWMLMKQYVLAAILSNQLVTAKAMQELPLSLEPLNFAPKKG